MASKYEILINLMESEVSMGMAVGSRTRLEITNYTKVFFIVYTEVV